MLEYLLRTAYATRQLILQKIVERTKFAKSVATKESYGFNKHSETERAFEFSLHELLLAVSDIVWVGAKAFALRLSPVVDMPI